MTGYTRRPWTLLEQTLGHRVSEQEQEYYDRDVGEKGHTWPGHNYEGPGNSMVNGEPVDNSDEFARRHDLQYFDTTWRYNEGELTQKQAEQEIRQEDRDAIAGFQYEETHGERFPGLAGSIGLQLKDKFEDLFGHTYPRLPDVPQKHPYILPARESHIANEEVVDAEEYMSAKKRKVDKNPSENSTLPENEDHLLDEAAGGAPAEASEPVGEADLPSGSGTAGPAPVIEDIEMNLPGTAKGTASGGASSDGQVVHYIERPLSNFGKKISVYKKSHKFMTFGLASVFLPGSDELNQNVFLSTHLAEIPWHCPALYLNQSEFDLIPVGSQIKEVRVMAIYRGSAIQFETNQTATSLATLNQINDISVAEGLNKTGWGSNVRYSNFNAEKSMIPTGIMKPVYGPVPGNYRGMVRDYYGNNNDNILFTDDVPKHQVGRQTFLYNYFALSQRAGTQAAAESSYRMFGGWPALSEKITQMDGKTVVNKPVLMAKYNPKIAPIKQPLKPQSHGLPFARAGGSMTVPGVNAMVEARDATITRPAATPTIGTQLTATQTEDLQTFENETDDAIIFNIYTPIEKSQYMRSGFWSVPSPEVQPSLHIGVQPTPALTTAALTQEDGQFNAWTDTRAYWEVIAEMHVQEHQPTAWPYAIQPNVPVGEAMQWTPYNSRPAVMNNPRFDGATFAGLYTTESAPLNNNP